MDALLLSLILCLSTEVDGALAHHFSRFSLSRPAAALVSLAVTVIIMAVLSAFGGLWLRTMLTPEARGLLLAFALAMAGGTLLLRAARPAPPDTARNDQPLITLAKLLMAGMGSSAPLLIAAIASRYADPWMAGIGGGLGCVAACVLARAIQPFYRTPMRFFHYAAGGMMLIAAFLVAVSALRLV